MKAYRYRFRFHYYLQQRRPFEVVTTRFMLRTLSADLRRLVVPWTASAMVFSSSILSV